MKLILAPGLEAQIAREARVQFPRECCGLMEGLWRGAEAQVLALHPAPNRAADANRFEIDPATHLAAQRMARGNGHELIGCYHSHPNGVARPSRDDIMGAAEKNFLWLIAALDAASAEPILRAYVYSAGFTEIGVVTGADLVTSSSKDRS